MTEEITTERVREFQASFTPWGYRDIETALEAYMEAGLSDDDLAEAIELFSSDTDTPLDKVDPVYVAFNTLHQEARTEIEEKTGVDIFNDAPYDSINVYGNYMCTEFDGSDDSRLALQSLINTIPNQSSVVKWLYSQM